jgi:hypothetical protein
MANRDLVGLLTNTPLDTQPRSFGGNWREALLQQSASNAQRMNKGVRDLSYNLFGVDMRTPQEKIQAELSGLDLNNMEDMKKLVGIVSRVDPLRAAQMADRIKAQESAMAQKQEIEDQEMADRVSLSTYVQEKYPDKPQLAQLVQSGIVTAKNLKDFLPDATKGTPAQFGGSDTWVDSSGNYFYGTQVKDPRTKTTKTSLSPVDPNGPAQPVGNITPVSSSGETSEEKQARMIETARVKEQSKTFITNKAQAVGGLPALLDNKKNIEDAQKILETLPTGGPINIAAYGIEDFFGLTSGNRADFERVLAMETFKSLKPIFGGVISDPERKALLDIAATVGRGNKANSAIIKRLIKDMNQRISQAELYSESENFDEYNAFVKQLLKEDEKPTTKEQAINWGDL